MTDHLPHHEKGKDMKNAKRILSLFLILALLLQVLPLSAFAATGEESQTAEQTETTMVSASDEAEKPLEAAASHANELPIGKPGTRVEAELQDRRDETQKHFQLEDGSYIAVDYGVPVHYSEDDGETWEDIDNTLTLLGDEAQAQVQAIGSKTPTSASYVAKNGENIHSFAQSLQTGFLFASETGHTRIGMSLSDSGAVQSRQTMQGSDDATTLQKLAEPYDPNVVAEISYPAMEKPEEPTAKPQNSESQATGEPDQGGSIADQVVPKKLSTEILYRNVYEDVDLLYQLYSVDVKESIVIHAQKEQYRFCFDLSLSGLTAILQEDGSVLIANEEGVAQYLIPAPYMYDAAGAVSDSVAYTLTSSPDGSCSLTVTADSDWINAGERVFPVVIDPTLIDKQRWSSNSAFGMTYVMKGYPAQSHPNHQYVYMGYNEGTQDHEAYMGWDALPTIPYGSEVTNAQIYLWQDGYTNVGMSSVIGELHEIPNTDANLTKKGTSTNKAWITNLTWDGRPDRSSTVMDYAAVGTETLDSFVNWDLTELVKRWYRDNPAIKVAAITISSGAYSNTHYGMATFNGYGWSSGPMFVVTYRDFLGIEPYYSYQSLGADRAGSAYIADYTGNLAIVTPLISYASGINPFSLNLVYNSAYFAKGDYDNYTIPANLGYGMYIGSGMTLDVIQKVKKVTLPYQIGSDETKTYLKYTDGDGTSHYFATDSEKQAQEPAGSTTYYYDEDGLGLKITEYESGSFRMEDDKGHKMFFIHGFLTTIEDANENTIKIYFRHSDGTMPTNGYPTGAGDQIDHIDQINKGEEDNKITLATFTYETHGGFSTYVKTITDAADNVYTFEKNCQKLLRVKRNGSAYVSFTHPYDSATNRYVNPVIDLVDNVSGYSVHFDYTNGKVSQYVEKIGYSQGAAASITYDPCGKTQYRDWGNDRIENNTDDILTTYLFDYAGRTVNAYTTDAAGAILGASNAVHSGTGSTDKQNNRTLRSASAGVAGMQYSRNGGFELTENGNVWTMDAVSSTGCAAVIKTGSETKAHTGNKSLKTWVTATATAPTGCHRSAEQLSASQTYSASVYVNTSEAGGVGTKGIYIKVVDSWGVSRQSEYLNYKTDPTINDGWVKLGFSFQPAHTGNQTVYICNEGVRGAVYYDDFQLELSSGPSNVNLLENGGLNISTFGWKTETNSAPTLVSTTAIQGSKLMRVTGSPTTDRYVYQDVTVNQPSSQTYVLSGWARANAVPDNVTKATGDDKEAKDTHKQFGLRAILTYSDNVQEYHYTPFNPDVTEWQFTSVAIVPKREDKTVSTIRVLCAYEKNANTADFDNLCLVKEVAQTMTYDDDGNLESVKSTGSATETSTYSNGNLTQVQTGGNGTFDFTYDAKHNVTSAKNELVKENYTVNAQGNTTATSLKKADGSGQAITGAKGYTNGGNLVQSVTDARGKTTTYDYSNKIQKMFGAPGMITDAKGTITNTAYLNDGRVDRSYIASNISVVRTYNSNGTLKKLDRGGYISGDSTKYSQYYNFAYDTWGNTTSISVGNAASGSANVRTLASYTYGARDGLLQQMAYGNGANVNYTYDNLGRKLTTSTSSGNLYQYFYTGDGQLYRMVDNPTSADDKGLFYDYTYDSIGRLIGSTMSEGYSTSMDRTWLLQTQHKYDSADRLTEQTWKAVDKTFKEVYTYDTSGRLTKKDLYLPGNTSTTPSAVITPTYDGLSRASQVTTPASISSYTYTAGVSSGTTALVSKLSVSSPSGGFSTINHWYTYDNLGNITQDKRSTSDYTNYTYDNQGQLTRAYRSSDSTAWNYTYDTYGNLRSKNYEAVGVMTIDDFTYIYGDTNWRDLLTGISGTKNGTSFSGTYTYDVSGNPEIYYNLKDLTSWSMTWKNGRQLSRAQKTGLTVNYDYDVNGLRTEKTENGITHKYLYAGGKLLRETRTGGSQTEVLDFIYDQNDRPFMLYYQKGSGAPTPYYYILNLQGDVEKLVTANGATVAAYSYDPYGQIRSATGTLATTNPLRYRGYYYDDESGWYYLQSRYYDPTLGRFINADALVSTGQGFLGYNMFAYCRNSPVLLADFEGESVDIAIEVGVDLLELFYLWLESGGVEEVITCFGIAGVFAFTQGSYRENITDVSITVIDNYEKAKEKQQEAAVKAATVAHTSTPASPPDPDGNRNNKNRKETRRSCKEKSSDKPSWVNINDVDTSQTAQQNATRIMNQHYGVGNWDNRWREFSQIAKWIQRYVFYYLK